MLRAQLRRRARLHGLENTELLGLPFVAINRPNYLDSSGWVIDRSGPDPLKPRYQAAEGRSHLEEEGHWFHELIFPSLWQTFGAPNGCTALVTTSHSMGCPPTIIAAALYSSQEPMARMYPYAGIVLSGLANGYTDSFHKAAAVITTDEPDPESFPAGWESSIHCPPYSRPTKELVMLSSNCCESHLEPAVWKQTTPVLIGEYTDLMTIRPTKRAAWQAGVRIPVLHAVGSVDWTFQDTGRMCRRLPGVL